MIALRNILIATDFSECSDNALKYAKALAEAFGANLHLIHVVQDPFIYAPAGAGYPSTPPNFLREAEASARAEFEKIVSPRETADLHLKKTVRVGSPFIEIIRYARAEDIDLIVVGTHGRGPISHMLLGSVAEKVVRKAPCPVLTVRFPEHEFVMP